MANRNAGGNALKSRADHELRGTFRKDRHGDVRNPEPSTGRPDPPLELSKTAQDEWDRVVADFEDMGTLHKVDRSAIYQYCQLFAETETIAVQQSECAASIEILEQNIPDIKGPELVQVFGQIVILRKLVSKCTDQLRAGRMAIKGYLVEFGLTTSSRGRIKLPAKAEDVDEFTSLQQARVQ